MDVFNNERAGTKFSSIVEFVATAPMLFAEHLQDSADALNYLLCLLEVSIHLHLLLSQWTVLVGYFLLLVKIFHIKIMLLFLVLHGLLCCHFYFPWIST